MRTCLLLASTLLGACGGGAGGLVSGIDVASSSSGNASNSSSSAGSGIGVSGSIPFTTESVSPPIVVNPNIDTSVAAPSIDGWMLVWSDEFSTAGLPNSSKWTYDIERNKLGWYNNELQYYSNARLDNARVQNGNLVITARQERLTSAADYGGQNYTSARLITRGLASWTYGFWEVRAKLPCGLGTWPAIWMLGTGGKWPDDGEIDILEQKGTSAAEKLQILGTVHTKAYNWAGGSKGVAKGASTSLPNACTSFNNYQMTWDADRVSIGVNGVNYFVYPNPKNASQQEWPFNAPQYLILNLAMGGDLGGNIDTTKLPAQMEVDYVRVYRRL
jgi:beta-glucanase (GH16 family)